MRPITKSAVILARACQGNPVLAMIVVAFFYLATNAIYAMIETLIWGDRFLHWFDIPTALAFMAYGAYAVYYCAAYHKYREEMS